MAKSSDDELLPLGSPTKCSPASSLEHMDWPCVSAEIDEDIRVWSVVFLVSNK